MVMPSFTIGPTYCNSAYLKVARYALPLLVRGHDVGDQHGPVVRCELALPAGHGVGLGVLGPDVLLDGGLMGFSPLELEQYQINIS